MEKRPRECEVYEEADLNWLAMKVHESGWSVVGKKVCTCVTITVQMKTFPSPPYSRQSSSVATGTTHLLSVTIEFFFGGGSNKWNCTICIFWGVWHVLLNIVFLVHQCFSCISQSFLLNSVLYYSNWRLQCVLNECIFGTVNIQVLELNDLVMTWYYIYFIIVYLLYYIPVLIVK